MADDDQKYLDKEVKALMKNIRKKYGEEAILDPDSDSYARRIPRFSIKSPAIADVFGPNPVEGGLPRGRMIEVFGPEGSGKTSLSMYLAANVQNQDVVYTDKTGKQRTRKGVIAYIDAEHAIDKEYASTFGLDMDKVLLSQPSSGEEALNILEELVESKLVDMIIVDSVSALTPQAEIEGEMGDQQMGLQARLMGKACRKLTASISHSMASVLWINQIRMTMASYGNPETTGGGKALKFFTSVRLEVRKIEFVTKRNEIVGMKSRIKVVKNKTAPPMKKKEITMTFGKGFEDTMEWVDYAVSLGVIVQGGPYYTLPDGNKFQGKDAVYAHVESDDGTVLSELKEKIRERIVPANAREEIEIEEESNDAEQNSSDVDEFEKEVEEEVTIDV